jgi:L-fucose mutarotase/ribose pyranase (RbsD/FucU family)
LPREDFYVRAGKAFAVVQTSDTAQYGNILLKKGNFT